MVGADARARRERNLPRGWAGDAPRPSAAARPARRPPTAGRATHPPNGGPFGGNSAALTEALAYVKAHGGGTIGVSSQTGASAAIIDSGADVAGLGGFSGRESEVSVSWLEQAAADGRIRWVLVDGTGGMGPQDGRTGSQTVMDWVQANGTQVADGLYELSSLSATSQDPS